jgi:hypothetical protein
MSKNAEIRRGWLKFMYIYTAAGAGGVGLGMILAPRLLQSQLGLPSQDPVIFGMLGSVIAAIGLLACPGLKYPLKFLPVLLVQLVYKSIWLLTVALPLFLSGRFPGYAIMLTLIFSVYIAGALIAIPFRQCFRDPD